MLVLPVVTFEGFHVGPLYIYSWGLAVAFGILASVIIAIREFTRSKDLGLKNFYLNHFWDFVTFETIAIFLGARLLFILENLGLYKENLFSALYLWEGGFSLYGGVLFGIIFAYIYARASKVSFLLLGSMFTPAWMVGLLFGRLGCFLIHDHVGKITNLPWGFNLHGGMRHEPALYEIFALMILFAFFYLVKRKKFFLLEGKKKWIFPISVLTYNAVRFFIDFTRADLSEGGDERFFGLTLAQWTSAVVVIGIALWSNKKKIFNF